MNRTLSEVIDDGNMPTKKNSLGSPFSYSGTIKSGHAPTDSFDGNDPWTNMKQATLPNRSSESQNGKGYGNGSTGLKGSPSKL